MVGDEREKGEHPKGETEKVKQKGKNTNFFFWNIVLTSFLMNA